MAKSDICGTSSYPDISSRLIAGFSSAGSTTIVRLIEK
jgi:hypothetical protein